MATPPPSDYPAALYAAANFPWLPLGLEPAEVPPGALDPVAVWIDDRPAAARAARSVGGKVCRLHYGDRRYRKYVVGDATDRHLCLDGQMR